jgi:hypothetical protein
MAQPWAPHVACYCDVSGSDAAHTAARHALEAMLAAGDTTLLDLVRRWGVTRLQHRADAAGRRFEAWRRS